jgi:hypothetical protein
MIMINCFQQNQLQLTPLICELMTILCYTLPQLLATMLLFERIWQECFWNPRLVWPSASCTSYLIYKVPCPSVCLSVTELGSVTDGRPGPARQNGIPLMSSSAATRRRSRFCRARARDSRSALRACVRLSRSWNPGPESRISRSWNPVSVYRGSETQVLRAKCSNTAATEEGSRVRESWNPAVAAPNRTCMASKIRFSG